MHVHKPLPFSTIHLRRRRAPCWQRFLDWPVLAGGVCSECVGMRQAAQQYPDLALVPLLSFQFRCTCSFVPFLEDLFAVGRKRGYTCFQACTYNSSGNISYEAFTCRVISWYSALVKWGTSAVLHQEERSKFVICQTKQTHTLKEFKSHNLVIYVADG